MSGAAHPQSPVRQQIVRDDRRARIIALACVGILAALLVVLVLALAGDDSGSGGAATPAVEQQAIPEAGTYPSPGTRYDGGPEEGTRGVIPDTGTYASPATRYDGGPEEGTRGAGR